MSKLQLISNLTSAPFFAVISFLVLILLHGSEMPFIKILILALVAIMFPFLVPVLYIIDFAKFKRQGI